MTTGFGSVRSALRQAWRLPARRVGQIAGLLLSMAVMPCGASAQVASDPAWSSDRAIWTAAQSPAKAEVERAAKAQGLLRATAPDVQHADIALRASDLNSWAARARPALQVFVVKPADMGDPRPDRVVAPPTETLDPAFVARVTATPAGRPLARQ